MLDQLVKPVYCPPLHKGDFAAVNIGHTILQNIYIKTVVWYN